ncbi:hypothetical protein LTR95_010987, partial [Oleoguttula sp. CCFEE 5521]
MYYSLPNQRVRDDATDECYAADEAEEDDFEYPEESSNSEVSSGLEEERRQYLEDHGDSYRQEHGMDSERGSGSSSDEDDDDDLARQQREAQRDQEARTYWDETFRPVNARIDFYESVALLPGNELEFTIRLWRAEHPENEFPNAP